MSVENRGGPLDLLERVDQALPQQQALFPEPAQSGPWPRELLADCAIAGGLRYVTLWVDEERDCIVFMGHPDWTDVSEAGLDIAGQRPKRSAVQWLYGRWVSRLVSDDNAQHAPDRFPITRWDLTWVDGDDV
jgi:hypothetical protein